MKKYLFLLLIFILGITAKCSCNSSVKFSEKTPFRGASSTEWAKTWQWSFVSGNGTMGAMVFGDPINETIVANHARLFLPLGSREVLPDMGKYLPEVRKIIAEKGYGEADAFMGAKAKEQGYPGLQWTDPFHPGFFMHVQMPENGTISDYLRTENFENGEVSVTWKNNSGQWVRNLFVSRTDSAIVMSIRNTTSTKFSCSLWMDEDVPESVKSDFIVEDGWITCHNVYQKGKGGYDGVVRIVTKGGQTKIQDKKFIVEDATEVLLYMKIQPWKTPLPESEAWAYSLNNPEFANGVKTDWIGDLKKSLAALSSDYDKLLFSHAKVHGEMFNRVSLDLGGGADRLLTTDILMERAAKDKKPSPALIEKVYDAGRYMLICSAGDLAPNLQGIWTGTWTPIWSGDYTLDANIQCAIASAYSANMPELMKGYFKLIESYYPDMSLNAQRLYGCRGFLSNTRATNTDLMLHWGSWPGQFMTSCGGWLAHWFYDYYQFTGDKKFLAEHVMPLLKGFALFYEDFLKGSIDQNGKYIYRPSFNPESGLGDNATIDIAVMKEVLTNLISASKILNIESDNILKWEKMIKMLPDYRINEFGELAEFGDPRIKESYGHRHHSQLYPVFQSYEFSPEDTPALWEASKKILLRKMAAIKPGEESSFGRTQGGLSAAYLRMGDEAYEILRRLICGGSFYTSLMASHDPDHQTFNVDGNGGFPEIINNMLVFSRNGKVLDLLPALPKEWPKGEIKGLLARGELKINKLGWNLQEGKVHLQVTSGKNQSIGIRLPNESSLNKVTITGGKEKRIKTTGNQFQLELKAGKMTELDIAFSGSK